MQFARQWGNSEQTAPQSLSPGYLHLTTSCKKIVVSNFFRFYIYSQVELLTSAKSFPETQSLLNLELCIFLNKAHLFLLLESHFSVIFLFTCLIYQTMVLIQSIKYFIYCILFCQLFMDLFCIQGIKTSNFTFSFVCGGPSATGN